ncbi:MAG TPA: DUF4239 domain-containing protein [Candidatus Baltobacteraceae bacterium]|nr:DUF4239 domain-containing protein [Candidatus Baltobacteraceae bacterium]
MGQAAGEIFIVFAVVAVAVVLHAIFQNRFKPDVLRRHNDVAGFLFSAVGVIYAVVLGFVVVVVWEKYDATVSNVESEVAAVADLYRSVGTYPEPQRSQIRDELTRYVDQMITAEWPLMSQDVNVNPDALILETAAHQVETFVPRTVAQSNAQQAAIEQVVRLFDSRRERLIHSAPSVPGVLWFALVIGAMSMLAFAFLFGSENRPAQLVMTAILAGLIAVLFVVIDEFDSPFSGSVSISDDGWVALQQHLTQIP